MLSETLEQRCVTRGRDIAVELERGGSTELRWFVANTGPLTLDAGQGVVLAMYDVTERRHADEMLRFQTMLLESQNEASIDGILVTDEQGRALWSNRRFAALWELPREPIRPGSDVAAWQFLSDRLETPDKHHARVAELTKDHVTKSRDEVRLKDGRTFDGYSAPVTDQTGAYLGRVWLFRDITRERALQASVAQSDRLASMGMLAAGVAHEINNPLSYVLHNLESLTQDLQGIEDQSTRLRLALVQRLGEDAMRELQEGGLAVLDPVALADMRDRFRDALSGTQRIKDIARGLGTFSRVDSDRVLPIDVRVPIESAISIAFNEIKYRARLVKDFGACSEVLASDGRLSQVFLNLLVNAAHSISVGDVESNSIRVRTWECEGQVLTEIRDTGCGIPAENLQRIFDPFFTTKPIGIGTGLGLNIARNIIGSYGGSIEVTSEVGKGTAFLIRLPVATTAPSRQSVAPSTERGTSGVRGRVLVVDDEVAVRSVLRRILGWHEVVEAESGEVARDIMAQDQNFDVILCDIMMPCGSGIEVHQWLVKHHPDLGRRLVFLTGGAFTPGASTYLEHVDNISIEKPFDGKNLQKMVAEWVHAARTREREP
jgi:two-component system, cell cycle sensor histidine kinase and response regulator CckA